MLACAGLLAGCGSSVDPEGDRVRSAVEDFAAALQTQRGDDACRRLSEETRSELEQSEGKPCARAITSLSLPEEGSVGSVDVYGRSAKVELAHDVLFLAFFGDDWKVVAAGCSPRPSAPYDCTVKGG